MTWKKYLGSAAVALMAFGTVSLGSSFESEAVAANQSWDWIDECSRGGCSKEEIDEYYRNGSYAWEVITEPGPGNREEMLELNDQRSQSYCNNMLEAIDNIRPNNVPWHDGCRDPRLGY